MPGYLALVLHAHLPFVRHPEHPRFLEESWLYEAITETYLPLVEMLEGWRRDRINARITVCLSPTLCAMLLDPLLQARYERRLNGLIELAEREVVRTHWDRPTQRLAEHYVERLHELNRLWRACGRNLAAAFRRLQDDGRVELVTTAATHALLPLLVNSPGALQAQVLAARDYHRQCFGRDPIGFWLPECAYAPEVEWALVKSGFRWFMVESHGLLNALPRPRFGTFAPAFTPNGLAVFGRDWESARQVWSRHEGYPGDPRYRDFYRDIGFDLDLDYVEPYLPSPGRRGFTGIKYHAITGVRGEKTLYDPAAARVAVEEHARHFLRNRVKQMARIEPAMDRPPVVVAPYDAELFGHWWHEGLDFLDTVTRLALARQPAFNFITPTDYLRRHSTNQIVRPAPSTWGDRGHLGVWLNERNEWIQPHLRAAEQRLSDLAQWHSGDDPLTLRAVKQIARELMLAQASDWPFMVHTGTNADYARHRVETHLCNFLALYEQITTGKLDSARLAALEETNNLFPKLDPGDWVCSAPPQAP